MIFFATFRAILRERPYSRSYARSPEDRQMKNKVCLVLLCLGFSSASVFAQTASPAYRPVDPMAAISSDVARISSSVRTLSDVLKAFVDKWEKVSGLTLTEKQQRLVLGMELLTRTELRVVTLQKSQIELTEKLNTSRSRLSQVEIDLRPRNINNSTTFDGTTETEELRESRRQKLQSEKNNLSQLVTQIQGNLTETGETLRDAQSLADRLRRTFLPQIERELYDQ